MAAALETNNEKKNWLGNLVQRIKTFISIQGAEIGSRATSPTLTGINFIQEDYTPAKLIEHPGAGSHEDIEPMK